MRWLHLRYILWLLLIPLSSGADPVTYRIGLMGGLGMAPPESEYDSSRRVVTSAEAEINWAYFGAEADAYYGFGVSQNTNVGTGEKETAADQSGAFGDVKVQVPFTTGPIHWMPKFGVGYGIMSVDEEEAGEGNTNVQGTYLITGIEFEHRKKMLFDFDYAFSVGATGGYTPTNSSLSASFYRVRVGAFYRVEDQILVGIRAIRHGLVVPATSNEAFSESQLEFLGAILFEL